MNAAAVCHNAIRYEVSERDPGKVLMVSDTYFGHSLCECIGKPGYFQVSC